MKGENGKKKNNKKKLKMEDKKVIRKEIGKLLRREIPSLTLGSLAMVGSSLSNQAMPKLLGKVLDDFSSSDTNVSNRNAKMFYTVVLGGGLASWIRTVCLNRVQLDLEGELRRHVFERQLQKKGESVEVAKVTNVWQQDIPKVTAALTTTFANVLRNTSSVSFALYHMVQLDSSLVKLSATLVPAIGASAMFLHKSIQRFTKQYRQQLDDLNEHAQDRLNHVELVQLNCQIPHEIEMYEQLQEMQSQVGKRMAWLKGGFMAFIYMASATAISTLYRAGGKSISSGKLTHGQLSSFATYTFLLGLGTSGLFKALSEWNNAMTIAAPNIFLPPNDTENKETFKDNENKDLDLTKVKSIQVTNVSFSYSSKAKDKHDSCTKQPLALNNVSLTLTPGKVIALVGNNGSGKSTLARILASLQSPQSGSITVQYNDDESGNITNNSHLHELTRQQQSQLVQYSAQRPDLLNMSVQDNIKYSNYYPTPNHSHVESAISMVQLSNDMLTKNVGKDGNELSGGQAQRVALARAFAASQSSFLMVLDEPTSSMDAVSESTLQQCKQKMMSSSGCLLLITHKLSTLKLADEIHVMDKGQITKSYTQEEFVPLSYLDILTE